MSAFNVIMQFMLQTGGIVLLMFIMQPIMQIVGFDSGLWGETTLENQARRDALYQWSLIIPVVAMGANIVWMYRAVQRKSSAVEEF